MMLDRPRDGHWLPVQVTNWGLPVPTGYDWHLLAGDDTALPAMARRLAELPVHTKALAVIEVDNAADVQRLAHSCTAEIEWVLCHGVPAGESHALIDRMRELAFPQGSYYAWVAAETQVARALRRLLIECKHASPKALKAASYWRIGSTNVHDVLTD
jgi:NADPH-dependent ferric siderophore reductase